MFNRACYSSNRSSHLRDYLDNKVIRKPTRHEVRCGYPYSFETDIKRRFTYRDIPATKNDETTCSLKVSSTSANILADVLWRVSVSFRGCLMISDDVAGSV